MILLSVITRCTWSNPIPSETLAAMIPLTDSESTLNTISPIKSPLYRQLEKKSVVVKTDNAYFTLDVLYSEHALFESIRILSEPRAGVRERQRLVQRSRKRQTDPTLSPTRSCFSLP